ncbi:MAG: hypothetical protein IPO90_01875 [Flavobacteriales bacterium]|nr:hypothetical protein [Flavobacteriales bacterium]
MTKQLLLCAALACSTLASAQTYFYIDEIAVVPQQPTTFDNISINLIGGLSSTGACGRHERTKSQVPWLPSPSPLPIRWSDRDRSAR